MHRQLITTVLLGLSLTLPCSSASAGLAQRLADGVGDCASVTASARLYYAGYNHVVTLANRCQRAVSCEVWTNVDPTPRLTLHAKPGESAETITRVGSPSREVQAGKLCHFGG